MSEVDYIPTCVHALGAITKSDGSLRPITDCRRPLGQSINNYMQSVCEDFSYISLDQVTSSISPGVYFSVLDVKSAYRSVNVFPEHRQYQGFVWNYEDGRGDKCYEDNCLCFGLRCAPFIYTQITEFVVRCLNRQGFQHVYGYLDDFIVVGSSEVECKSAMSALIDLLHEFGFIISWKKVVPPSQCVTYLGIELESVNMPLRLPDKKVIKLKDLVTEFSQKSSCTLRELQVLAGHLAHASTVVRGGRTFSRRVINLLRYSGPDCAICVLPDWFHDDLEWWMNFCQVFNGYAKIISDNREWEIQIETDSSMTGFGARWGTYWFLGVWHSPFPPDFFPSVHYAAPPDSYDDTMDINLLELWPIVVAAGKWGHLWRNAKVRVFTDNTQVMSVINTGRSRSARCMAWVRELFWISFLYNFHMVASRVSYKENVVPDFLSRFFDPKRSATIPRFLTWDLCCFRQGRVEDPVAYLPTRMDGKVVMVH